MLFKASITKEVIEDEDLLVEQLYIFLDEFVKVKLCFESEDTRDDCKQDAIMFLLEKARSLTTEQKKALNLEKYFYNRANSYISSVWLGRLNRYRKRFILESSFSKNLANIISSQLNTDTMLSLLEHNQRYNTTNEQEDTIRYIDYNVLNLLINNYPLPEKDILVLLRLAEKELNSLGLEGNIHNKICTQGASEDFKIIAHAIVDEYIIFIREGGCVA